MRVLFLTPYLPSLATGHGVRSLNFLKSLHEKYGHDITLVSLVATTEESRYACGSLEEYCGEIVTLDVPKSHGFSLLSKKTFFTLRNMLSFQQVLSRYPTFFNSSYVPSLYQTIKSIAARKQLDVAYLLSINMAVYMSGIRNIPTVIDFADATFDEHYQLSLLETNPFRKAARRLLYWTTKLETNRLISRGSEALVVTTAYEKDTFIQNFPDSASRTFVIPNGVDIDYFRPTATQEEFPSLVFVGSSSSSNLLAVTYFCEKIYPTIRKKMPSIRLYIVGGHPPSAIYEISKKDESVTVTGYVEDMRPYLARSSVVVVPMISGRGIKNKTLEAMAMGKPVVSTSIGARGIDVTAGENIALADTPEDFASEVLQLLGNRELHETIGRNARALVEARHSWERAADMLNELIEQAAGGRQKG